DGGSPQETTARPPDAPTVDRAFAIVRLYLPPGTPVAVRGVTAAATTAGAASPRPAIGEWRPTLFHGARNFLGHSAAVAALVVLAVARSGTGRLLGAAPFLAIAALTGSRSAWLGVFVGAVILAIPRVRRTTGGRSFGWGVMPFVALVGLVGTWAIRSSLLEHQTSRLDIFAGAVQAFLDDPWRGLAGRGIDFADYWQTLARDPGGEAVTHAHNLWLQAAATHGVIGLTATTWLSLAFMILAWRLGRLAGVALVLGALTMSVLDVSFLFVYVQLPLMWGLNALDAASRSLQGGQPDVPPPRSP
ncbi:MAG: O-antigen ligase family protein, partial [Trueperaceae bacterium]|nr:O-antigen ligase family protein [Trueperaceae bacterium]